MMPGLNENSQKKFKYAVFIVFFLAFLFNFSFFVGRNSVDFPFWDQWGLVEKISQKNSISETILFQHNEHRFGVSLAIMEVLAKLTNWSQLWEIRFISLLIISSALIFLFIKRKTSDGISLSDLIIPLLFFNIFQFENIDWGFQIGFVLPLFYIALWLLSIKIHSNIARNTALSVISLLGAYSIFHGLIIPVMTIGLLLLDYFVLLWTRNKKMIITMILLNLLIIASVFINYQKNFQTAPAYGINLQTIRYFSLAVSNGFLFSQENIFWNSLLTLIAISFLFKGFLQVIKKKDISGSLIGLFLIFYSLIFVSLITFGRSNFGTAQALSSRYVTFTMLIPVGIVFILSDTSKKFSSVARTAIFFFVLFNSFYFVGPTLQYAQGMTDGKENALLCYRSSPPEKYKDCFNVFALLPEEKYLTPLIPKAIRIKEIQPTGTNLLSRGTFDLYTEPEGNAVEVSLQSVAKKYQNLKIEDDYFIPENDDPNFIIEKTENLKGISWKTEIKGKTKIYFMPEGEKDYSESNSTMVEGLDGYFLINVDNLEESLGKKIRYLRVDPTDRMEKLKIENFKVYR
jgi:hypothetical protein